ncbi:MAG TPA: tetratricopeptide repeat protein [Bryobacteraceae bacterium]|nr:tetratricopeptide repeat protein [Bryobacteraceae bacterium]
MTRTILLVVTLTAAMLSGQGVPKGFEHFYNLEYNEAIREFQGALKANPNDPDAWNHLAQAVLYREMFLAGALESELVSGSNPFIRRERVQASAEASKTFEEALAKTMALTSARVASNPKDTRALYAQGVAHGLRANWNFLVKKSWMDSLKDATAARKLHNQVLEIDSSFIDAKLVQGVHDYIVGSLPWHWKMLGFVAGFRGDRETGIKALEDVANRGRLNKYDAQVLLAAIYRRERKPLQAIPLLRKLADRFPRNYLLRLEAVQMYSDAGDKANALQVLASVEKMKGAGTPGFATLPYEKIWFYRGNLLFWYRDFDAAIEQLRKVTPKASTLDLNTALMSWLRLGQSLDMKGMRKEAQEAYQQAIGAAPASEIARESRGYLNSPYRRKG